MIGFRLPPQDPLDPDGDLAQYLLMVLLALAMGLQNAIARRLGVPDLTTTVLTLTLTGLAADSRVAGGKVRTRAAVWSPLPRCSWALPSVPFCSFMLMCAVLALALVLLVLNGIAAYRLSSSSDAWTVGT